MPFSVRLDPATEARIRRLARQSGQSKSSVVREAVARYGVETPPDSERTASAYARLAPYIGRVQTGGRQFSSDTHAKYRAALQRKQRDRRPR